MVKVIVIAIRENKTCAGDSVASTESLEIASGKSEREKNKTKKKKAKQKKM